jgi:hypothetical protein
VRRASGDVERVAHAADDVLALRVDQEVAGRLGRTGDLVAAERHAGPARVALVAEDHLLDVDAVPQSSGMRLMRR